MDKSERIFKHVIYADLLRYNLDDTYWSVSYDGMDASSDVLKFVLINKEGKELLTVGPGLNMTQIGAMEIISSVWRYHTSLLETDISKREKK